MSWEVTVRRLAPGQALSPYAYERFDKAEDSYLSSTPCFSRVHAGTAGKETRAWLAEASAHFKTRGYRPADNAALMLLLNAEGTACLYWVYDLARVETRTTKS